MNRTYHRVTALLLALVLTLSPAASASWALGHELYDEVTTLAPGVTYTTGRLWSDSKSDLRTERYVSYTPGSSVTPIVAYGASLTQRQTLTDFARALEAEGNRVLAGINGDYFVMSTGQPLGLTLTDGVIRSAYSLSSTSASHYAVGWLPDGAAFVGDPGLTIQATIGGFTLDVNGINKVREATGGYFIFNSDFGPDTMNSSSGVDVILTPVTEENAQQVLDDLTLRQQAILDEEYAKALAEAQAAQAARDAGEEQTDPPAPEEPTDPTGTPPEEPPPTTPTRTPPPTPPRSPPPW